MIENITTKPEYIDTAKKNLNEILSLVKDDVSSFIKDGGHFNISYFKDETVAFCDLRDSSGPSVTFGLGNSVFLEERDKVDMASTFSHEKVHLDDLKLTNGTLEEKAAGSLEEEVEADTKKFETLQKLWTQGKTNYEDLFGNKGILKYAKNYFEIDEAQKTFKFSKKGKDDYYELVQTSYQKALDKNYEAFASIYDRDGDHKLDLESLGHKYKGPERLKK